jgi:hypothetical protein
MDISVWTYWKSEILVLALSDFGYIHIGFPIYIHSYKMDISEMGISEIRYISDFRYIQTDMSIFCCGYIGMDVSEMMTSEVSEISEIRYIQISDVSRPICQFLALDISEMDISEMTSSNVLEFQYVHFRYPDFPINHPFYPLPKL